MYEYASELIQAPMPPYLQRMSMEDDPSSDLQILSIST